MTSFSEILRLNRELENRMEGERYRISLLSNIVCHSLKDILEYQLRIEGVPAAVETGDYDNIIQSAEKAAGSNAVVVIWELSKLIEGFQYKADLMSAEELDGLLKQTVANIDLCLKQLSGAPLVFFSLFSKRLFSRPGDAGGAYAAACDRLNRHLLSIRSPNLVIVDTDQALAAASLEKSVDWRFFYSSQALYTVDFFHKYVEQVKPAILSVRGKAKKALIFDCDNTLWKGIVAEDGLEQIQPFEEVQAIALNLRKNGIILGLCSKNNAADVDEVLEKHPGMLIRAEHLTIKKVNWQDKASNLREIAKELNIGLDSLVFVDDSSFETELIRAQVPEVKVLQVPEKTVQFPAMMRAAAALFHGSSKTQEDAERSRLYEQEKAREADRPQFASVEEYLASLKLKLSIQIDDATKVSRIAQLTQKTNQFNLTTRRYTEAEISRFVQDDSRRVFTFELSDRFGGYGLTAVGILALNRESKHAEVDTLLMSCRVIGRNVEYAFFDFIVRHLRELGIRTLEAEYRRTPKNAQVADFYLSLGFKAVSSTEECRRYRLDLESYAPRNVPYIISTSG